MNQQQRLLSDERQLVAPDNRQGWQGHHAGPPLPRAADVCQIHGEVDTEALLRSIHVVAGRNHVLRSRFPSPKLVEICDEPYVEFNERNLSGRTSAETERIIYDSIWRPFNLTDRPCWRVCLFQLSADRSVLVISFDHLIMDGYSLDFFKQQVSNIYTMLRAGRGLDENRGSNYDYYDWSDLQWARFDNTTRMSILADWERELDVTNADLDIRWPSTSRVTRPSPARVHHELSPESTLRTLALAAELRTTPYTVLLSAFIRALDHFAENGASDAVVLQFANRTDAKFRLTLGWMANTSLVPTSQVSKGDFRDSVRITKQRILALKKRAIVPLHSLGRQIHSSEQISTTRRPAWAYYEVNDGIARDRWRLDGVQISDFPRLDHLHDVNADPGFRLIVDRELPDHFILTGHFNTSRISHKMAVDILQALDWEIK